MKNDRKILRKLAGEYFIAAQDEKHTENMRLHRAVNDLNQIRPVVLIDEIPFHELDYDGSLALHCEDPILREAEEYMRQQLFKWKHFPADMFLTPYIPVQKIIQTTGIGVEVRENLLATDPKNNIVSHAYLDQIPDGNALEKLHVPELSYDKKTTWERFGRIADAVGDILPVRITGHKTHVALWDDIGRYHGITNIYYDLAEQPEFMHALISKFTEIYISQYEQMERLGLFEICLNDIHCTPALSESLPGDFDGEVVRRGQIWGKGHAQVFGVVSREMHEEFCIGYMCKIMEPFGLVYYGCCEPLDKKIDLVEKIPNLRKISITPWADNDVAAEAIGKKYVFSGKPNPSILASKLDENVLRKEISGILSACKRNGCNCDIVLKDISTVGYCLDNLLRWEQIVMEKVRDW